MASRQNTIFSLPLLVFMVGAAHFYAVRPELRWADQRGKAVIYLLIGIVVLRGARGRTRSGKISGRGNTGLNVIYETHRNAMYTGFALIIAFYVLAEIILKV